MKKWDRFWKKVLILVEIAIVMILIFAFIYIPEWQAEQKIKEMFPDTEKEMQELQESIRETEENIDSILKELEKY